MVIHIAINVIPTQTYLNSSKEIFLEVSINSNKCRVVAKNSSSGMGFKFNEGNQVVQFLASKIKHFESLIFVGSQYFSAI